MAKITIELHDSEYLHDFIIDKITIMSQGKGSIIYGDTTIVNYKHRAKSEAEAKQFLSRILTKISKEVKNCTRLLLLKLNSSDFTENY